MWHTFHLYWTSNFWLADANNLDHKTQEKIRPELKNNGAQLKQF